MLAGAVAGVTFLVAELMWAGPASAAVRDWYVAQLSPACSDSGPGSVSSPFCHIAPAAAKALAGDTVHVAEGSYSEQVSPKASGTADAPVTYLGSPGTVVTSITGSAFKISSRSWITVSGFTVVGTLSNGITVSSSSHVVVSGNDVSASGEPVSGLTKRGIYLSAVTDSQVSGNVTHGNSEAGIYLDASTARVTVSGNTSYANARGYTRAAPGIDVRGDANLVVGNVTHNNEDTGLQFYNGADSNVVTDNVTYDNGDHGIDDLGATNQVIVGNTVYGNVTAGINLEGGSTGGTVRNNISVDNGIGSPRTKSDIRVDSASIAGTTVDYDLVWLRASSPYFVWGSTSYTSLAAFRAATGQEAHGLQADPEFVSVAGDDYRLKPGSPAIDAADSGAPGEQPVDVLGAPRVDDPATPDTGAGPRTYDDRGAYELQPSP